MLDVWGLGKSEPQTISGAGTYTFKVENEAGCVLDGLGIVLTNPLTTDGASKIQGYKIKTDFVKVNGVECETIEKLNWEQKPNEDSVNAPMFFTGDITYYNCYYHDGDLVTIVDGTVVTSVEVTVTLTDESVGIDTPAPPTNMGEVIYTYSIIGGGYFSICQGPLPVAFDNLREALKTEGATLVVESTNQIDWANFNFNNNDYASSFKKSEDNKSYTASASDISKVVEENFVEGNAWGNSFLFQLSCPADSNIGMTISVVAPAGDFEPFEIGLYVGGFNPDITIRAKNYGQYTIRWEGSKEELGWLMVKSTAGDNISTLAEGTEIKFTSLKIDDTPLTFNSGESWSYKIESNGKFEAMLKSHTGVYQYKDESAVPKESVEVTFEIIDPNAEPEPEPVPKPVAPEGYEIVYELDLTDKNIEPNWQGISGDNAAIAAALQKDGAYVEFITCYPGATAGWIRIELEDGTQLEYNSYDSEIRSVIDKTDRTSIVRLPNEAVLDAIKQAQEKGTAIKGISLVSTGYSDNDTAKENKCLGLFIYAKIPGDEPDEPCTHPEESREWKSDAENHWQVCKKCGEEVPETKKPHDALTYEELDSEKHTVKCDTCSYSGEEEHSWDGGKTVEATETEKGYILYTCEKCKAEKKVETAHVHNGDGELKSDEDSHWYECTDPKCPDGGIYGKESHTYENGVCTVCRHEHAADAHTPKAGTYKSNGDTHTYVCDVCGATVTEGHKIVKVSDDPSGHYDKCEFCDYQTKPEPHTGYELIPGDFINHYVKCSCGYTAKEAHTPGADYEKEDNDARYHICTKCGGRCDPAYHDYTVYVDDENGETHHIECSGCGHVKPNSTEKHTYENGVCTKCEYAHADHDWKWTPDFGGTTHSRTCSICHKTETAAHTQGEQKSDENNHWYVCSECNAEYNITKHVLEYVTDGANGHHQECTGCEYKTETVAHSSAPAEGEEYTDFGDGEHHTYKCAQCGDTVTAAHNFEKGAYEESTTDHWQICKDCKGESVRENHKYIDGSDRCSVCNYWNHQHTLEWKDDGENHWQECSNPDCDYKTEKEPHVLGDKYDYNDTQHSRTCTVCGKTVAENHQFGDYKFNAGMHWHECSVCQYKTDYNVHTLDDASDATSHWQECTAEGCDYETEHKAHTPSEEYGQSDTQHWSVCTECGEKYNYSEHTLAKDLKHDADGHWTVCSVCGYESTEKNEHTWDTGKVTVEPTETTEGVKTYTCTECGETKTESVPKSAHKHVAGEEWKFDEKTHWHECVSETCDDKSAKLDEAAHTEDEGTVTKAATETEEGVMTFKCTVCGAVTRTEAIPKVKHTHVAGKDWKFDEKTHWHECVSETCDDKTAKLDEAEHVWDDGKVTVEPTYTKEGEKLYTCEVCGETKTETVPVKGHEHSTVTKSDEKGHWEECTICGEIIGEVEAHTPGEWITDSEATSTEAGKRHKECTVCGYVTDELTVPAVGDIDVEVPTVGNVPKVELPAEQQEVLKNAIIDEEDVEAIENGASIDIELTVENAESTIAPEDKAKSDEAAAQGSYTHVRYLDINLTKVVTDASGVSTSEEISELGKEVRIVITVPLGLARQSGRDFAVIRVHDGEATVLKDLDSDPNTVTISTNLFSSYTLVYVDTTPVPSTPGGLIGHVHVITGLQNDAHYHWRGCFICSMRVDYEPHRFINGVCTVCGYRDPDYVPEVEEEEPAEAPDTEVTVVDAPAEGTEQGGDSEGTPEVTDTPADLPETEAEVVEVKEDDETSENPKTGVVFTGIGAVMAAIAALIAKRK